MYFIKRITIDEKNNYKSSQIVNHTDKSISTALSILESSVKMYVKEERGREASEQAKIIDIHNIDQVTEPVIDSILLYRLENDPHKIYVYQKQTTIVKTSNWTWSTVEVPVSQFRCTDLFELEEYTRRILVKTSEDVEIPPIEMVHLTSTNIKVPKQMTIAPMCNLINELKLSSKFKERFELMNALQ